ncbi:Ca-activated chloride channel family protein [Paenibacillus phyllosphaerae]|uniref:Ca-activated chloride channel family protein n=1 Tax=Paenibacillus phyllosphaerae TaxID=274593 RepID=A0A7W5B064_9BACL|nr:VWA domain-containing protein [Paenibacillus phyllosphaerae]MBB3111994.1 Ca-activated chloride channel family protein [Paenibacillus phyllosphaerae]
MKSAVHMTYAWSRPYFSTKGEEKVYLLIELKGTAQPSKNRAPLNVSLVLDRSGSMHGEPLAYSKQACQFVVEQMDARDQLSLVAFDNEVTTVFPPSQVTLKDKLKQQITTIESGGSTNLSGGLLEGAGYVRKGKQEGTVNRVILLSDGHANVGITDRNQLVEIAREYYTSGVGISAMGVGDGFDEELMEVLAEYGGGNFHYIRKPDDIPSIFEQELQGLLSVVAQNVKITLQPSNHAQITGIYGYRAEEQDGVSMVQAGDLFGEEVKGLLIEMSIDPHASGTHTVLMATSEYIDVTEGAAACTLCCEVKGNFSSDLEQLAEPADPNVMNYVQLMRSAKTIETAMEALDQGDVETGKALLQMQADEMYQFAAENGDAQLQAEAELLAEHLPYFAYSGQMRKELHAQKYRQMKRR